MEIIEQENNLGYYDVVHPQFPVMDKNCNVVSLIALDTRGHGKSQRGDAPFTIKQLIALGLTKQSF